MVVIWPCRMPTASCSTFTTGARQLVVQDAAGEISVELLGPEEPAGALQHDVAAEIAPGDCIGCGGVAETDAAIADVDGAFAVGAEAFPPAPVDAVEFQQVRGRRSTALQLVH